MGIQELSQTTQKMNYPFNGMRWEYRQREIAKHIPKGSSVLDVGGGLQTLKEFLDSPSDYVSLDVDDVAPETIVADLNTERLPIGHERIVGKIFDFAVCQGVFEYIDDIETLLFDLRSVAKNLVVTYYQRKERMDLWRNNHDFCTFEKFIDNAGWEIVKKKALKENSQRVYLCLPKNK